MPPLDLFESPKGGKILPADGSYDEAGNISTWSPDFILCNGDTIGRFEPDTVGSINFGVPDPIVHATFEFPQNAYQIKIGDDWIGQPIWTRMWYPVANAHRDPDITKLTPYTHQSFNLAVDQASDLSTIEQLTLPVYTHRNLRREQCPGDL